MDDHSNTSVCGDGERQIVWAWAMDAKGRQFPESKRSFCISKMNKLSRQPLGLQLPRKYFMKRYGQFKRYIPWTAQRYINNKHYENTPIQIYLKYNQRRKIFR